MYSYFKGTVTEVTPAYITIECGNVGYLLHVANPYQFELNQTTTIYIHHYVREDAILLYGFATLSERNLFITLISVKGLGPKGALAILASTTPNEIVNALDTNNAKFFCQFPGIGQKLSQQIILDLKGKINLNDNEPKNKTSDKLDKVASALKSLGYNNQEIKVATKDLPIEETTSLSEAIKLALKRLKKN